MKKIIFWILAFVLQTPMSFSQHLNPNEEEALITFRVTDHGEVPEEGAVVTVQGIDTLLTKKAQADIEGMCQLLLPEGKKYKMSVNKFGEDFNFEKLLILPATDGAIRFEQKLKIKVVTKYLRTYPLENVYFDINDWKIQTRSYPALDDLWNTLKNNSGMKIEIAGHTDNTGDDDANMKLSQQRANEVMTYLITKGISRERLLAKGYGETVPIASNDDEDGRQNNRRTEVRIISE
jgi:flagellar motor protein MotB